MFEVKSRGFPHISIQQIQAMSPLEMQATNWVKVGNAVSPDMMMEGLEQRLPAAARHEVDESNETKPTL